MPSVHADFVSLFLELTKQYESPTSFWRWSCYAGIAALLRNNIFHPWGTTKLYPNIYVLLLADSAKFRKDAGPSLIEELLREISHTKVISGRASWQGILDELSQDIGNKKTGVPLKGGSAIIIAPELSAFFVSDTQLIPMITDGYAFAAEFPYTLRGGKVVVKNRCITLLAASNETLLREVYDMRANEGGLLRRTYLIKPDEMRLPNALMETTDSMSDADKKVLLLELNRIKILAGEVTKTKEAKDLYVNWYKELYKKYSDHDDRTGFYYGIHALVFKLAIIIAASYYSLCITEAMMEEAIKQVIALKNNYNAYAMGTGRNPQANMTAIILLAMWQSNGTKWKRRDLLLKYWNEISSEDLDKLIATIEQAGLIRMIPIGSEPAYELTDVAREAFKKPKN